MQLTRVFSAVLATILLSFPTFAETVDWITVDSCGALEINGLKFRLNQGVLVDHAWKGASQNRRYVNVTGENRAGKSVNITGVFKTPYGNFNFSESMTPDQSDGIDYECQFKSSDGIKTNDLALVVRLPIKNYNGAKLLLDGRALKLSSTGKSGLVSRELKGKRLEIPSTIKNLVISGGLNVSIGANVKSQTPFFYIKLHFTPNKGMIRDSRLKIKFKSLKYSSESLNISKAVNMGFSDKTENDQKGGWTDQGPEKDLSSLKPGVFNAGGIKFKIIDPDKNGGKSCIVLAGKSRPCFPKNAEIVLPSGKKYRWIYLLHAIAWAPRDGDKRIGTVRAEFDDKSVTDFPVLFNREIADWTLSSNLNNGKAVWSGSSLAFGKVFLYVSRFPLDSGKSLNRITLLSAGKSVWGVVAISASADHAAPVMVSLQNGPAPTSMFRADRDWKPINFINRTKSGSALDFSFALDAPAGKYGPVVCRNGRFEFASRPGVEARFFGVNISNTAAILEKKDCHLLADCLARNGYNAVRFQHIDQLLGSPGATTIDMKGNLDKFCYLLDCLRRKGIYYTMDMWSLRAIDKDMGVSDIRCPPKDLFSIVLRLPVEDAAMKNMQNFALSRITFPNPYNGLALKDDPAFLPFNIINENTLFAELPHFHKWKQKYIQLLEKKHREAGIGILSDKEKDRRLGQFVLNMQIKSYREMRNALHQSGMKTPTSDLNRRSNISLTIPRKHLDYVDNHIYWDLYPASNRQQHQLPPSSRFFWFPLKIAPSRIFGKAFACTESEIVYINPYRAQYSTLMSAFAGLQGWSEVQHFNYADFRDRVVKQMPTKRINFGGDPLALFGDRIGALLYTMGNVKPAAIKIPYVITTRYVEKIVDENGGPDYPAGYMQLGAFAQIGTMLADQDSLELKDSLFLVVPHDMEIPEYLKKYKLVRDTDNLLRKLKEYGIPKNTGFNGKTLISSTGQITYKSGRSFKVITPQAESLILQDGIKKLEGKTLKISNNVTPCVSFLGSLDRKPLENSKRMLFLYLTDLKNTGTRLENNKVKNQGHLPMLVQKGRVTVTLRLTSGTEPEVWALKSDGTPVKRLSVRKTSAGFVFTAQAVTDRNTFFAFEVRHGSN